MNVVAARRGEGIVRSYGALKCKMNLSKWKISNQTKGQSRPWNYL